MKRSVLALLFFCAAAAAQSPLGLGYPLGIFEPSVTGAAAAMGGSGTAVIDELMGICLNPANAAIGDRASFSATVSFDLTNISDNGRSSSVSGYAPKLLSLIIPIGKVGSLAFAMQKRYNANLNFYTDTTLQNNDDGFKSATIELYRTGGLTAWQAGWAYRFGNNLGIGLTYEKLFFNRDTRSIFESTFDYELESGLATYNATATETEEAKFSSDGIRFGMQVPVHEKVTFGVAAEYIFSGSKNASIGRTYKRVDNDNGLTSTATLLDTAISASVGLPPSINIGAVYKPDERWLLVADAFSTLWDRYDGDVLGGDGVRTNYGISVGARFVPAAANKFGGAYIEKCFYSAGLRYAALPYDGVGAHEYALTAGVGLPIPNDGGVVDIVIDIGRRTDARYSGYAENTVKFQLGINGGRSWYQKDTSKDY